MEDHSMAHSSGRHWWAVAALVLLTAGLAAGVAYNLGLSQGLAQVPVPAGSVLPYADGHGWHRPWGFGFLIPLAFVAFWAFIVRGFYWRPWGMCGGPWRYGYDYRDRLDDWHRRAHERMSGSTPAARDDQSR